MPQNPGVVFGRTSTGVSVPLLVDSDGALVVSGTSDDDAIALKNITTNQSAAVGAAGPGVAEVVSVNTAGATSALVLYDGTSTAGTKLGTFSTIAQGVLPLDFPYVTGLFAVTTGGTPADITIRYRPGT